VAGQHNSLDLPKIRQETAEYWFQNKMRLTLKAINDELARRGYTARLAKSTGYFYFQFGEAASWLDRTVNVPTLNSLTLPEWIIEFELLRKFNGKATRGHRTGRPSVVQRATVGLPCPRITDSGSQSDPSITAEMPARRIAGKTGMVSARLKQNKSSPRSDR
jgi:hypothetical protein